MTEKQLQQRIDQLAAKRDRQKADLATTNTELAARKAELKALKTKPAAKAEPATAGAAH